MPKKQLDETFDPLSTADFGETLPGQPPPPDDPPPPPVDQLGEPASYEAAVAYWTPGRTPEEAAEMLAAHSADGQYFIPR